MNIEMDELKKKKLIRLTTLLLIIGLALFLIFKGTLTRKHEAPAFTTNPPRVTKTYPRDLTEIQLEAETNLIIRFYFDKPVTLEEIKPEITPELNASKRIDNDNVLVIVIPSEEFNGETQNITFKLLGNLVYETKVTITPQIPNTSNSYDLYLKKAQ